MHFLRKIGLAHTLKCGGGNPQVVVELDWIALQQKPFPFLPRACCSTSAKRMRWVLLPAGPACCRECRVPALCPVSLRWLWGQGCARAAQKQRWARGRLSTLLPLLRVIQLLSEYLTLPSGGSGRDTVACLRCLRLARTIQDPGCCGLI